MIVRSAAKEVSKTRSKPSQRRAVVMAPATSVPCGTPNSSPKATETAGACCTTTSLSLSFRASMTSWIWLFSVRAPVGQTVTHWPQFTQLDTFRPSSKAVPIFAREPRPMKSMAETCWTSSQIRTHLLQRMHLAGSRTIEGLEASSVCRVRSPAKRRLRTPNSSARSCNSQLPLRTQYRQSSGWLASSSSMIVLRAWTARGECVRIFMPSAAGKAQLGTRPRWPSTSTTHIRQAPVGVRPSMWQSVGTLMPARRSAVSSISPFSAQTLRPLTSMLIMCDFPWRFK